MGVDNIYFPLKSDYSLHSGRQTLVLLLHVVGWTAAFVDEEISVGSQEAGRRLIDLIRYLVEIQ